MDPSLAEKLAQWLDISPATAIVVIACAGISYSVARLGMRHALELDLKTLEGRVDADIERTRNDFQIKLTKLQTDLAVSADDRKHERDEGKLARARSIEVIKNLSHVAQTAIAIANGPGFNIVHADPAKLRSDTVELPPTVRDAARALIELIDLHIVLRQDYLVASRSRNESAMRSLAGSVSDAGFMLEDYVQRWEKIVDGYVDGTTNVPPKQRE